MTTLKDTLIEAGLSDHILTEIDLENLSSGTTSARYALVNKALKKEELIQIRRGLYMLSEKYRQTKISKFYLANQVLARSYISLESAFSYYGWIPEQVTAVYNMIRHGRTRIYLTPFGEFIFYYAPINDYEFLNGVVRVELNDKQPFLIATPLRALVDYVYVRKIEWQGLDFLTEGFRIEKEYLLKIQEKEFSEMSRVYRSKRVLSFLKKLKKELKK